MERFICDDCVRRFGIVPKRPADSGASSWLCVQCGHHNIGSVVVCKLGNWGVVEPVENIKNHTDNDGTPMPKGD